MKVRKTMFVSQLPEWIQDRIYADVKVVLSEEWGEGSEEMEYGLSQCLEGRVADLSDTVNIKPYLELEI